MAKKKTNPAITLSDLRAALLHDTRRLHTKEIDKITRAKQQALLNLVMEFGTAKTIKMFDRFEAQREDYE